MKRQSNRNSFDPHDKQKTVRIWTALSNGSLAFAIWIQASITCWWVCQQVWLPMSLWTVTVHTVWALIPKKTWSAIRFLMWNCSKKKRVKSFCFYEQLHEDSRVWVSLSPIAHAKSHPFNPGLSHRLSNIHEVWACAPSIISLWWHVDEMTL